MNILNRYKVWVAQYPGAAVSDYAGKQLCGHTGNVAVHKQGGNPGIAGNVDMNVFILIMMESLRQGSSGAPVVSAANAANVQYLEVNEVVTATSTVNLRTVLSTDSPDTISQCPSIRVT